MHNQTRQHEYNAETQTSNRKKMNLSIPIETLFCSRTAVLFEQ